MTYLEWFALSAWFVMCGALMFLWGLDEIKYAQRPHPWTDPVMFVGLKFVVVGAMLGFYATTVLSDSCDSRPSTDPLCLAAPGVFEEVEQ